MKEKSIGSKKSRIFAGKRTLALNLHATGLKAAAVVTVLALCMSTNMLLGSDNIIANGSFEDGKDQFPLAWKTGGALSNHPSRGIGKLYFWDKDVRKSGSCSLCFY